MYLLRDMERKGLLEQIATYTLLMDAEVQNDSKWRLGLVKRTQNALLAWMQEQDPDAPISQALVLNLGQAEAAIRTALRQDSDGEAATLITASILASILECSARDGLAWGDGASLLSKRPTGRNKMEILLRVELPRLVEMGERRIALMTEILDAGRTRLRESGVKGKGCKVELSLNELKALIDRNLFLGAQVHDQDAAIEGAMYAIEKLGVAQVRGGRTVIRQAMGLRLVESAKSRRFSNQDMQELSTHYREKCVQIHIVGLFARWGVRRISEAMRLVLDYFRLSRREFLKRYREALGDDVDTPADPAVVDSIVTSLKDPDQEAIVTAGSDANLLVLAGPGSGKTLTLVHRIAYLVCIRRIPPWRIFVLTFNRMAAELIRRRLRRLIGQDDAAWVRIHTYHALAIRTLGISLDAQVLGDPQASMELDDMIPLATQVIQGEQSILGIDTEQAHEQLLGRVSHLLVDEYQDINLDQYNLVSAITQRVAIEEDARPSIFVVGDDDQNIYAFNGTSTEFIRRFEEEYKADRAVLSSNYRSTANIIDVSQRLIRRNTDRMKRDVTLVVDAARREEPSGQPVRIVSLADGENEVGVLLGQLISWAEAGVPLNRIAVLARRNDVLHALRRACELQKIPVRLVMPGKSPGRLSRVRECVRFLSHLDALGEETVERQMMLDTLDRLRASPRKTRWDCLLARLVETYWAGIGEGAGVPASALRGSLLEALHEAGREFTYGEGVFLATVHASKGLQFDRVLIPSSGWRRGKNANEHAEERRLLYVGMTRARRDVVINAASSHPFGPELAGEGTEKTAPSHAPTPIRIGAMQYEVLSLAEIHLGYAGYFSPGHAIHAALARATAEREVELRAESDRVGIYFENIRIGRLSKRAAKVWMPRLNTIEKATIIAIVKRLASQGTMHQERNQCEEWEVPVLEVRRAL
jgi:ATP-dependent DNA helicase RecQ